MNPAILIVGHGSRDKEGTDQFLQLVDAFKAHDPDQIVECGFLEFAKPLIQTGVDRIAERKAKTVVALPGMLMAAGHAKNDIPSEIHDARAKYPEIDFHYGRQLHLHSKIIQLCRLRIEEEEAKHDAVDRKDTLLMVVGRGSSDPDANADIQKLSRMLWECMGFGWGATSYIGVTFPLLPEALERCQKMGYKRILVFSFFLFTGILEKRIHQTTLDFDQKFPDTQFVYAHYLNIHPLLFEVFQERAREAIEGSPNMNCELCKYRVALPSYEHQIGQEQVGHHHHVRGLGQDGDEGHHHDHHHNHHHHHE